MAIDIQKQEILVDAIKEGSHLEIAEEIKKGLNINERLKNGDSLLHTAFYLKKYNVAQHLILLGASLSAENARMKCPLHFAAQNGFYEGAKLYVNLAVNLNQQDDKGRLALMYAIKYRHKPLIKLLMGRGTDTSLEDSNGYSSLMWAIKFLNPEELKEIFSDKSEDELSKEIERLEDQTEMKVEVLQETLEHINENSDEDILSQAMEVIPNPLKELVKKKSDQEEVAPYSISEHLQSLREKSLEQGEAFDYDIHESIQKSEDRSDSVSNLYEKSTSQTDKSIDSFARKTINEQSSNDQKTEDEASHEKENFEHDTSQSENIRVSSTNPEILNTNNEIQRVKSSSPDIIKNEFEMVSQVNSSTENDNEIQQLKKLSPHESNQTVEKNEDSTQDQIKEKGSEKENSQETNIIKGNDSNSEEEIMRVQSSKISTQSDIESWTNPSKKKQEEVEAEYVIGATGEKSLQEDNFIESKSTLTKNDTSEETNIVKGSQAQVTTKKSISYLKDGYSEVYKDEYAQIRTVDKNIGEEIDGEIQTVNKQIGNDELEKIKDVNKEVRGETEVQYLEGERIQKVESVNLEGKITNEEVDGYKSSQHEEAFSSKQHINRPDRVDPKTFEEEVFSGSIKPDKLVQNEVLGIAKGSTDNTVEDIKLKKVEQTKEEAIAELKQLKEERNKIAQEKEEDLQSEKDAKDQEIDNNPNLNEQEKKLLKAIEDPDQKNKKGQSLCWLAANNGQLELLKKLIHKGANYEIKDPQGISPLMAASMKGHVETVDYLTHKVRNIDEKRRDGHTALSLAIEYDQDLVVRTLIDRGASSEAKIKGNTLLMQAAEFDAVKSMQVLVMVGADPLEKNIRGKTALDIAKMKKKKRAYVMLSKIIKARLLNDQGDE